MEPAELRVRRRQLSLTQAQLAAKLGVAANTVARWERGATAISNPGLLSLSLDRLDATTIHPPPGLEPARQARIRPAPRVPSSGLGDPRAWRILATLEQLVDRDAERAVLARLVLDDTVRLVTITGMPGCGKTRLAIDTALALEPSFADGAVFVDLAPLRDPSLVLPSVARQIGLQTVGKQPQARSLTQYLSKRRVLLIIDNCEHVLAGFRWMTTVLAGCPLLTVLTTSRTPLRMSYEHELRLAPLRVPSPEERADWDRLRQVPSVAFFVQRARMTHTTFDVTDETAGGIAELCAALDGLPLALQLAAAHVRVVALDEVIARMGSRLDLLAAAQHDQPPRHQSLRAAISWSYHLLTAQEQALFRTLCVFVGDFSLPAVEATWAMPRTSSTTVVSALTTLVESSLVAAEGHARSMRYRLLETLREFGLEQLSARGETRAARRRHAHYFCAMAREAGMRVFSGPDEAQNLEKLDLDFQNVRSALEWSASEEPDLLIGTCAVLWDYWLARGDLQEGNRWTTRALSLSAPDDPARGALLQALGVFSGLREDMANGERLLAQSVTLLRASQDPALLSRAITDLAYPLAVVGDQQASDLLEEALALARQAGADRLYAYALLGLGWLANHSGEHDRAVRVLRESVAISRANGCIRITGYGLVFLAMATQARGDPPTAAALCEEALGLFEHVGEKWGCHYALLQAAFAAAGRQDMRRAACLLGAVDAVRVAVGATTFGGTHFIYERGLEIVRTALGEAAAAELWAFGYALPLGQAIDVARGAQLGSAQVGSASKATGRLTPREREVAVMVALGQSNRAIADELVIAVRTVETHVEHIFEKLNVHSRVQLARWVLEQNLFATAQSLPPVRDRRAEAARGGMSMSAARGPVGDLSRNNLR
jgi:non-specific serine/threonine protein kinase